VPLHAATNFKPEWRLESSIPLRVSFVNLQKFTFHACVDVPSMKMFAPEAENAALRAGDDHAAHFRVLEAYPLQRVRELDVDAEVVRIELELVARTDAGVLVDVHRQRRDRTVERELPMRVAVGMSVERDERPCAGGVSAGTAVAVACAMRFSCRSSGEYGLTQLVEALLRVFARGVERQVGLAVQRLARLQNALQVGHRFE
jgi:hypothetical protein